MTETGFVLFFLTLVILRKKSRKRKTKNKNGNVILELEKKIITFDLLPWVNGCLLETRYFGCNAIDFILQTKIDLIKEDGWKYLSWHPGEETVSILEKNIDKIDWYSLSLNTNIRAISLLEPYCSDWSDFWYERVNWRCLSKNENAIFILEKYPHKIAWGPLSSNNNAIHLLKKNVDKIEWFHLSRHARTEEAIDFLDKNIDKLHWLQLSLNENAISILEKNIDKIVWSSLSYNRNAISILEKNSEKIDWVTLSGNENAISILEKNIDKINWDMLSSNRNAISLLEKNQHRINYRNLSFNSDIFTRVIHYQRIKQRMDLIREELMMKCMHPARLQKWIDLGGCIDDF